MTKIWGVLFPRFTLIRALDNEADSVCPPSLLQTLSAACGAGWTNLIYPHSAPSTKYRTFPQRLVLDVGKARTSPSVNLRPSHDKMWIHTASLVAERRTMDYISHVPSAARSKAGS